MGGAPPAFPSLSAPPRALPRRAGKQPRVLPPPGGGDGEEGAPPPAGPSKPLRLRLQRVPRRLAPPCVAGSLIRELASPPVSLQAPENPSLTPHARPPPAARMPPRTRAGAAPCGARRGLTCSVSPLCLGAAAMENKGLNVFNTSCVLAKPETGTRTAASRAPTVRARVGALRGRPRPVRKGDSWRSAPYG